MKSSKNKLSSLSVFFPAYNEEDSIPVLLRKALTVLPKVANQFELIVIDDGSADQTKQLAQQFAQQDSRIRVVSQSNQGYGGAVRTGFNLAKYDWIFFTDSDLQFDLNELPKLVDKAQQYPVVLGYRLNRVEGWKRHILALLLKIWNRIFLGFPAQIKDVDCAYKLISRSVFNSIKPLISKGAMISTELLLKVHLSQIDYTQVGVNHYPRQHGQPTGNNFKVILTAVKETILLRRLLKERRYLPLSFSKLNS